MGIGHAAEKANSLCGQVKGAEIHPAVEPGKPHQQRRGQPPTAAEGQQTAVCGLSDQGVVPTALELSERGLGAAALRQLAGVSQVSTVALLREVRRDDRAALGRDRGLLPAGEQSGPGARGGLEQQDPGSPKTGLRLAGRGISAAESFDLHVASDLRCPCRFTLKSPTRNQEEPE